MPTCRTSIRVRGRYAYMLICTHHHACSAVLCSVITTTTTARRPTKTRTTTTTEYDGDASELRTQSISAAYCILIGPRVEYITSSVHFMTSTKESSERMNRVLWSQPFTDIKGVQCTLGPVRWRSELVGVPKAIVDRHRSRSQSISFGCVLLSPVQSWRGTRRWWYLLTVTFVMNNTTFEVCYSAHGDGRCDESCSPIRGSLIIRATTNLNQIFRRTYSMFLTPNWIYSRTT